MNHLKPLLLRSLALLTLTVGLLLSQRATAQVLLTTSPLIAGQNETAGLVLVFADDDNVYVRYLLNDGWTLNETHLAVVADFASIPQTKNGNVRIGHFEYGDSFSGLTQDVTYSIPRSELGTLNLFVAAHAVVERISGGRETAWAGPYEFAGKNWATYMYIGEGTPPNR